MLNISNGKINRAQKVVIYGAEGIGKTTFASRFPDPLFIDTEGGTAHIDVRRIEKPTSWEELISIIEEVASTAGVCGSLVIDTADWAEQICIADTCAKYKKAGIEEFGYGKGYTYVAEEFSNLLIACNKVIAAGINVVITAHAKMRKFEQPDEMGAYDRWEMKLSKQVAPLLKEWCDMLLFCNYKTFVVSAESSGTKKAQGGKRVVYTSHHPCWDAKNRHNLPDEMELDYFKIAHIFEKDIKADEDYHMQLLRLLERDEITSTQLQEVVAGKGYYESSVPASDYPDQFIKRWVIPNWGKIVETIKNK